ncbi:Protein phosphatase 2C [Amphibacillus marinus]|uniref:Protein phosphatase 2C n=1 Tax=Amphibacillus marinus TaxID=872970 RepID=A0A1H8R2X5_9BACI|nr:protein phosphatase 2C domain-containing protein [Amphibacillus marinus]SEO61009.1 Protein phosphatase 2C [Amphibacillus marinus]
MFKRTKAWSIGLTTDKGPVKKVNEDRMLLRLIKDSVGDELLFALVADGMGGYQYGDLASQTIVDFFENWLDQYGANLFLADHPFIYLEQALPLAFSTLNDKLIEYGDFYQKKLGSTLTLLVLYKGRYFVGHVGDSRIYHWEKIQPYRFDQTDRLYPIEPETEALAPNQTLTQLTDDHSWVNQQVKQGQLSKQAAQSHPKRHVLLQCLGIEAKLDPYFTQGAYQIADIFVLCSDGVHTILPEQKLISAIELLTNQPSRFQQQADLLVQLVSASEGATDNITLMLIQPRYLVRPRGFKHKVAQLFLG